MKTLAMHVAVGIIVGVCSAVILWLLVEGVKVLV